MFIKMFIKFLIKFYNDINNDELFKIIWKSHEKTIKLMIITSNAQQSGAQMG